MTKSESKQKRIEVTGNLVSDDDKENVFLNGSNETARFKEVEKSEENKSKFRLKKILGAKSSLSISKSKMVQKQDISNMSSFHLNSSKDLDEEIKTSPNLSFKGGKLLKPMSSCKKVKKESL